MLFVNAHKGGKYESLGKYLSDLTKELNSLDNTQKVWHSHYILVNDFCKKNKRLPIRIPGMTVGEIQVDSDYVIAEISLNEDCLKNYRKNVTKKLQKYIGGKIEFESV